MQTPVRGRDMVGYVQVLEKWTSGGQLVWLDGEWTLLRKTWEMVRRGPSVCSLLLMARLIRSSRGARESWSWS